MSSLFRLIVVLFVAVFASGCAYTIEKYDSSGDNVVVLQKTGAKKAVKVGTFSAKAEDKAFITCRAAGPVSTPNNKPYADYIRDAFISELKSVGIYSETSVNEISAHLDSIDFNSNIGSGRWDIAITFSAPNKAPVKIATSHPFETSWSADRACTEVANAFEPAVQSLLKQLYTDPGFKQLIQ